MANKIEIYNLMFPPYVEEMTIGDYVFSRIVNYDEVFQGLMHLVDSSGSEFNTRVQTGSHQITAVVTVPDQEQPCALPWATGLKQLDDILFLLTLFTGRNVFRREASGGKSIALLQDHRIHHFGSQLILSIKYEPMWKHNQTGELKNEQEMKTLNLSDYNQVNVGFEKSLNGVLQVINSSDWQKEYEGGYFLFLFRSAIQRQIIETSFLACWTIWEHIFAINNRKWLDKGTIEQMGGESKISFILNRYLLVDIDADARKNIRKINKTRNRLVHFGKKTDDIGFEEMNMFIRLTEQLIAIVFKLAPSNAFNSFDRLDNFLKK